MRKTIILLVFILILLNLNAKTYRLRVLDEKKRGLADVVISTKQQLIISDSLGYFSFKTESDNPIVELKKISYTKRRITQNDMINQKQVILIRKSILMQGTRVVSKDNQSSQQIRNSQVIEKEVIADKTVNSIADWLKNEQGLSIKGNDLSGEKKSISLGGHSAKHTVVMLNGIVLNPTGQEVDLSNIITDNIESIEVIKNNASVESGSGAIAGIILIKTTNRNSEENIGLETQYGSYNSSKNTLFINKRFNNLFMNTAYTMFSTDNDFSFYNRLTGKHSIREDNSKFQQDFSLGLNTFQEASVINYQLGVNQFKNYLPGTYNYLSAYAGSFIEGYNLKNTLSINHKIGDFSSDLSIYNLYDKTNYQNKKAQIFMYRSDNENKQSVSGLKHTLSRKLSDFEIKETLEYKNEQFSSRDRLKPTANIGLLRRETYSGVVSAYYTKETNWFIFDSQMSSRIDYNQAFRANYSYRLEQKVRYNSYIPMELNINLGKSYMLPSFYDLYWKGDSQTTGNPNLKPEKSMGIRATVKVGDNPSIEQSYWINNTDNMIYWFRSLSAWKPGNISNAEIQNWESQFHYKYEEALDLNVSYTRTIAQDKSLNDNGEHGDFYNKYLIYTPVYQWHGELKYKYGFFTQSVEYQAVGEQYSTRDQLIAPLSAYDKWDLHSSFNFNKFGIQEKLNISLLNILDEHYEIYDYVPEPGFHWQVMLKLSKEI